MALVSSIKTGSPGSYSVNQKSSDRIGLFWMLGMGGGACATWKVVHDPPPISSAKRGQSHGKVNHAFRIPFEILHVIQPCGP